MAYTTIDNPELYFQVKLYTGSGANQSITLDGSEDMQPDLVWIKDRTNTNNQVWTDSVRGVEKVILSNASNAEATYTDGLTAFNSDGFSLGDDDDGQMNVNTNACVAWCWKEASGIFDIVTYTGTGSANNVSHSLSAVPKMFMVKRRDSSGSWQVYHGTQGATKFLVLNQTGAVQTASSRWNDTSPTSSVFTVNTDSDVNGSSATYVAYCFAEKQGFSKFGKFTGNGNNDGTFVPLSFRPAFLIIKETSNADDWQLWDNKREDYTGNPNETTLDPATSGSELDSSNRAVDFLSNGFKLRTSNATINTSGETFLYMAFAEQPFVNSNGVPCNAR